jgi:hypothetical protein
MSDSWEQIEMRLRSAGAAIFEGRPYDPEGVANACVEAADFIARSRPLPVVEVHQCFWCNRKRTRATKAALKEPHQLRMIEELCDRPGCDPIKGTYPWTNK